MAFWGKFLSKLGEDIPQSGIALDQLLMNKRNINRQDEQDERQRILDQMSLDTGNLELKTGKVNLANLLEQKRREKEGISNLGEYYSNLDKYNSLQNERMPEPSPDMVGPLSKAEQGAINTNALIDKVKKPDLSKVMPYMDVPAVEKAMNFEKKKDKENNGLFAGWKKKNDDRDMILQGINPYGENAGKPFSDETDAKSAMDEWETRWNTSGKLNITEPYIQGAATRAKEQQLAQIPGKISEAAGTGAAGTRAREITKREVQREEPMFSKEQSIGISQSAIALKNLQRIRDELSKGNVQYFDIIKKTGQFSNPKINNAYQQVSEIVGRSQSGAAIADHEWRNFGKEILNPQFLLTEKGRATALENIDDYIDRFYSNGELITSDPDWYQKYNDRGSRGRTIVNKSSPQEETKTINGITYKKVSGGWQRVK